MHKLLIATHNPGKLNEIKKFLDGPFFSSMVSLNDVGIDEDVEENGSSYAENSLIKARFFAKKSGLPALSDDGGLEIAALENAPGIHSKRWLGDDATEKDLINHMISVAKELPDDNRVAWFKTVITLVLPNGKSFQVSGEVKGIIAKQPLLKYLKGYPYRSFFYLPDLGKYYHENELSIPEMKLYNHRYKAIQELLPIMKKEINNA